MKRRQIVQMADARVRSYIGKINHQDKFTLKPRTLEDVANIFGTLYSTESLFDAFASHGRKKTMVMHLHLEDMVPDSPHKQAQARINLNKVHFHWATRCHDAVPTHKADRARRGFDHRETIRRKSFQPGMQSPALRPFDIVVQAH
eukprot:1529485-Rhodomonas_salina.6